MLGIIGKKIGMTSLFDAQGKNLACTVLEAGPCFVTQVRSKEKDGYEAVQVAFDDKKEKRTNEPMKGHFKKSGVTPKRKLAEFDFPIADAQLGKEIKVDIFKEGENVNVVGLSKGRGFQGVVKRHGFSGVGGGSHGQHDRQRAPGSVGASSYPSRLFKGLRMAGKMGNARKKSRNLTVVKVVPEKNLLVVSGSVPGYNGSYVIVEK